jgi:hypothetical protein
LSRPNYGWDVGIGWGRNTSNVDTLAGAQFLLTDNVLVKTVAQQGYPLGVIRSLGWVRCGISPDDAIAGVDLKTVCAGKPKGALYISDGTNDECGDKGMPCLDATERIIANPSPRWTGNAHSTIRYKKFEFSGLVDVKKGGDVWNGTRSALLSYGTHKDTEIRATCTAAGTSSCTGNEHALGEAGFYPGPVVGPGAGVKFPVGQNWYRNSGLAACAFTGIDDPCIEDGGYVKLRELSVAYTFDQAFVQRSLGMSSVEVRIAGRNLKTWTKYTGLDPETTVGGATSRVGGTDYFNLPLTRSVVLTVNLTR